MQIATEHGYLIPLHPKHADALFDLMHANRSYLYPWMPWLAHIHSPHDLAVSIKQRLRENALHLVIQLEDGTLCGGVGFYHIDSQQKRATLGFWLAQDFTGQGIMDDALRSACRHGFTEINLRRIEIRCPEHNQNGRQVAERLGFTLDSIMPKAAWLGDDYVDHACYSLTSQAFKSDGTMRPSDKIASVS